MRVPFVKLHGLGNDFIVFDDRQGALPASLATAKSAERLCRRGHGVGADGVLLVLPGDDSVAVARMRVLNADGSEPEMCGNGLRCVAKFIFDRGVRGEGGVLPIDTGAGRLAAEVTAGADGLAAQVRVAMGPVTLQRSGLPMLGEGEHREAPLEVAGEHLVGTALSVGNPHYVAFLASAELDLMAEARRWGPKVEHHTSFPRRTNVELARLRDDGSIELVVWERGCGITQACGTGACATVAAAVLSGRCEAGHEVAVDLPGGRLHIEVQADLQQVWMRGPAVEVYRGELEV